MRTLILAALALAGALPGAVALEAAAEPVAPAAPPVARTAAPAAGGAALVGAAAGAPRVLAGTVRTPRALDATGFEATLEIERTLKGSSQPGESLRFGWEELARSRPPRFEDGAKVVVSLVPLPASSLWRQRFPQGGFVVGAEGNGFFRDPDPRTLDLLEVWARLDATARRGKAGATTLAALVAEGAPPLAMGALGLLSELPGLDGRLVGEAVVLLASALDDDGRPEALRQEILSVTAARHLEGLRGAVERHAKPGDPLEAPALAALSDLSGGLPPEQVLGLLERTEPAVRAAAARAARGAALDRVTGLVAKDPAAVVRIAAVEILVSERRLASFDGVSAALFDPDAAVRAGAAQALARLGAAAVPGLEALLQGRGMPAAGPVLGALVLAGSEGQAEVQKVAASHADPAVRAAAALALGRPPSDH